MGIKSLMNHTVQLCPEEAGNDTCFSFDLDLFIPNCQMVVNVSASIISLLSKEQVQNRCIISQRVLTNTEMRVLLPLLESPFCCPQAVLHASYHCTYEDLLQSLHSPTAQWEKLVQEHHHLLDVAYQQKTQREEMRGVYNALFSLRMKLRQLGLTIRSRREGYYLSSLASE
jgi:hypothetical protein